MLSKKVLNKIKKKWHKETAELWICANTEIGKMKKLEEIIKPYKELLKNTNYNKLKSDDLRLINKWKNRIPKGWYGFDGINTLWGKIIDDFLIEVEKECPDFEIYQIKLKYGSLRAYIGNTNKKVNREIDKLEDLLFSEDLVY